MQEKRRQNSQKVLATLTLQIDFGTTISSKYDVRRTIAGHDPFTMKTNVEKPSVPIYGVNGPIKFINF